MSIRPSSTATGNGPFRIFGAWLEALALGIGLALVSPAALRAAGSSGTEFWLAFEANGAPAALSVQILGKIGTTGSVDVAGLDFSAPFTIPAGGIATVALPVAATLSTSDGVEDLGVHVTASEAVVVYGLDINDASADTVLALPVPELGMAHQTISYAPDVSFDSQFAVVATAANTHLVVTPTASVGSHLPGITFEVTLDTGQVYQAQSSGDLSGTSVVADHPVAVLSGNTWADVPVGVAYADHLVEQLLPTSSWGTDVFLVPSALRTSPERLRIQASLANTQLTISPPGSVVAPGSLDPGGFFETSFSAPLRFQGDKPISVSHFATGGSSDGGAGDPFLLVPLPVERFEHCYLVATADDGTIFPNNFANLVVSASGVGEVMLDGAPIAAGGFTEIGTTGFFYRQQAIAPGRHRLDGPLAFGASVYGFGNNVSYAAPAGGASPPYAEGMAECTVPEPTSLSLTLGAAATIASLASRRRRGQTRAPRVRDARRSDPVSGKTRWK